MTDRASILTPFGHRTFRHLWFASVTSNLGGLIQAVGAAWLMTSLTDSVDMVALVQAATTLPIMLLSLIGGAIADSYDRRRVMIAAQVLMLLASAALTVMTYLGLMSPWMLLALTFLIGSGTALNSPSYQATVGDLVPREQLSAAVAANSIGLNLSRSLGPALGGLIVAAAGVAASFIVNTVSYVALILVLLRWQPGNVSSGLPREAMGPAMVAGLRYAALSPSIWKVLLRALILGFTTIAVLSLLPVVATRLLDAGPSTYGLLLGAFGAGSVAGATASEWLYQRLTAERVVALAFLGSASCAAVVAVSTSPWLTGVVLLLGGFTWVLAFSLCNLSVQLASSRWVVGRSVSIYQTAAFGGMALGSWAWGSVAEAQGLPLALLLAAAVMLAGAALGFVVPLPDRSTLDLAPVNHWQSPPAETNIRPGDGPVVVHISYAIAPADLPDFLAAIKDLRRVRLRNGARRWMLLRDFADPDTWVECYSTPTWIDYVRHNLRMTRADAEVRERIHALHRGPAAPVTRCLLESGAEAALRPPLQTAIDGP